MLVRAHPAFFFGFPMTTLKTFIVEDSSVIRENLEAALKDLVPMEVVGTADDERSAVDWLAETGNHADLVIVDIFLKNGSGLGVLSAIKSMPRHQFIVVLTNFATPEMSRKCLELGANRVFDKSNEIDELVLYCSRLAEGVGGDAAVAST